MTPGPLNAPALAIRRAQEAQAEVQQLSALLIQRASRNLVDLANDLQVCCNAAEQGDTASKAALVLLVDKLERARLTAKGIHTPTGAAGPAPNGGTEGTH